VIPPFSYDLPPDRIAQRPVRPYHDAKLLVINRSAGLFSDKTFLDLSDLLSPKDLIVFNNTKVIPARFLGEFAGSGGAVEALLITPIKDFTWRVLGKPLRKFVSGKIINFSPELSAEVVAREEETALLRFYSPVGGDISTLMHQVGIMPIPPYIRSGHSDAQDSEDYQTPFGTIEGSVAAPTASLHFSPEVMAKIKERGAQTATITLHLNTASFQPLLNKDTQEIKPPPSERIIIPAGLEEQIKETKRAGGRVVAVGTSVVRSLESLSISGISETGATELFIYPGHKFHAVDIMVTNFHQPGTSHLMLVEAFLGRDLLGKSYQHALSSNYRFLSYGDGMVIF
jgi:S-adenosylmethionine:tRNA ribosyltransferase-isomerase